MGQTEVITRSVSTSAQNTVVIEGFGAYIGLPNKTENGDSYLPTATRIVLAIFNMEEGDIADKLDVAIVNLGDGSAWSFYLLSYHNPADIPPVPVSSPIAVFLLRKGFEYGDIHQHICEFNFL